MAATTDTCPPVVASAAVHVASETASSSVAETDRTALLAAGWGPPALTPRSVLGVVHTGTAAWEHVSLSL